jgi:protein subunit release factor A
MRFLLEIRPGEGGEDAKLLVRDQANIYLQFAKRNNVSMEIADSGS